MVGAFGVTETFCVLPRRHRHWQAVAWRRRERFALRLPRLVLLACLLACLAKSLRNFARAFLLAVTRTV